MIGPLHNGTLYPVDVTESGWKHARGCVTDLTKPFLATGWPLGAADGASAAANSPLLEEECATTQFKLDHSPDAFGHYVLRGKHWHKMSDFQITGLECTMVREAAGGDEDSTAVHILNCLKQDGTTVTVPVCFDKLHGRSMKDRFTTVDPTLSITSKLTVAALTDLVAHLPTPPSRTAPLRFGTQPNGDRLYSDCVLPADGSAPVPLTEAGLYLDEPYFKKGLGLGVGDYPTLLHVPLAEGRHACFRLMTDNWETVFGSNFVPAWLSMAYGVAGFHYCYYQEALGSWPLCYAYGGPDTGKTTASDIVKSLTGVQSALLAGSSITEPKLAQALSARADLCVVVDDFKPKKEDERMETASRMLAARSERSNMVTSFRPHSALLVSSNVPLDFSDPALRNKTCCLPYSEIEKPAGTPTLDWWSDLRPVLACLAPDLASLKLDPVTLGELQTYLLSVAGKTTDRSIKDKCPLIGTALCLLYAADQLWRVDSLLRFLVDEVLCGGEAAIAEKTAATPVQNFFCDLYGWVAGNFDLCKSSDVTIHVHNCLLEEWQRSSQGFTEPWVCINVPSVVAVLNKTRCGPYQQRQISNALKQIGKKEPGNVMVGNNLRARFLDCAQGQTYHQDPETHERRPVLEGDGYATKPCGCVWIRRAYLDKIGELRNEGNEGSEADQRSLAPTGFEAFYESLKDGTWAGYGSFSPKWLFEIEGARNHRLNPENLPRHLIGVLAAHRGEQRDEAIQVFDDAVFFTPRLERERPDDDEQSEHGTQRARVDPPTGGLRIESQGGGQGSARANASGTEVFDDFFDMDEAAEGMDIDASDLEELMAL